MKKKFIPYIMIVFSWGYAYAQEADTQGRTIIINEKTLTEFKKDIGLFISNKRKEKDTLMNLPSGNTFLGMAANFVIEAIIAPLFNKYGNVNVEEAKNFLGRTFENESLLTQALNNLEKSKATIAYLDSIFTQAEAGNTLSKKNGSHFLKIVKKTYHEKLPNPKTMGEKNELGEYCVCNDNFYEYSAAILMAFHIFENHVIEIPHKKKRRSFSTTS